MEYRGAIIGEKRFPFVRITIASQSKILKKFTPTIFHSLLMRYFPERMLSHEWKKFRSVSFEKNFVWKYFGIVPKELRCSQMELTFAGELQARFFASCRDAVKEYKNSSDSLNGSVINEQRPI